jgi:hypothetical protein
VSPLSSDAAPESFSRTPRGHAETCGFFRHLLVEVVGRCAYASDGDYGLACRSNRDQPALAGVNSTTNLGPA